jgi:hypothetical protein
VTEEHDRVEQRGRCKGGVCGVGAGGGGDRDFVATYSGLLALEVDVLLSCFWVCRNHRVLQRQLNTRRLACR